jgi:branched-chain amino acid transport system substrate-binding protein
MTSFAPLPHVVAILGLALSILLAYILKVERVGGRLQNTIVHTYPMVSQFWTYRPDEFLKTPAYDRNYPPAKP